jgi:hypothetical protein
MVQTMKGQSLRELPVGDGNSDRLLGVERGLRLEPLGKQIAVVQRSETGADEVPRYACLTAMRRQSTAAGEIRSGGPQRGLSLNPGAAGPTSSVFTASPLLRWVWPAQI